jgi:hypothetical protein
MRNGGSSFRRLFVSSGRNSGRPGRLNRPALACPLRGPATTAGAAFRLQSARLTTETKITTAWQGPEPRPRK